MACREATGRIVVAVDFGTTFSGVAAAFSASPEAPDEIEVIKTWPGGSNITTEKVPSEIAYGTDLNKPRWGYQAQMEVERLRCMKLMLEARQELPNFVSQSDLKDQLLRKGKDAQTVVADYLNELWNHARTAIERRWPFMSTTQVEIILTVPAVWSDDAKDATMRAAKRAGIGSNITLISEPEAAAVYTLKSMQPSQLREGNNYIVCDAGGGTVDLIAFDIKQVSPLRIEESAQGDGDCCGAAILNMRFEEYVRTIIGATTFDNLRQRKPRAWQTALTYFEDYVKRTFDPDDTRAMFYVPFPVNDGEAPGVEEGYLTMSADEVASIFEPVISSIVRLIESQIHRLEARCKSINGILLVGGFGQSECLFKKLERKFQYLNPPPPYSGIHNDVSTDDQAFRVLQPKHAWTAVVRGGVLRGLEGAEIVLSRISRRHYGVMCNEPFDGDKHPWSSRYWDKYREIWRAKKRMTWYISKGQTCDSDEPVLFEFYRVHTKNQSKVAQVDLIVCDTDEAPGGYEDGEHVRTRVLCTLTVDLSKVPSRYWVNGSNSKRQRYQALKFGLGMQIKSGGINFDLRIDDVVYGNITAAFE